MKLYKNIYNKSSKIFLNKIKKNQRLSTVHRQNKLNLDLNKIKKDQNLIKLNLDLNNQLIVKKCNELSNVILIWGVLNISIMSLYR